MGSHTYSQVEESENLLVMGWREWLSLPELKIDRIKAKMDTGARTSVLHAFQINLFEDNGDRMVSFSIHPNQYSKEKIVECVSALHDIRWITDSGGHKEIRPVIKTFVTLGQFTWQIEITLTNRDDMRFRFLLARSGIPENFLISASSSYLFRKKPTQSAS